MKNRIGYLKSIGISLGADDDDSRSEVHWLKKILQKISSLSSSNISDMATESFTFVLEDDSTETLVLFKQIDRKSVV